MLFDSYKCQWVIVKSSYTGTNIDKIMLNRRVFAQNERKKGQKKRRSALRSEILIIKGIKKNFYVF